ncbi:MAG: HDOD domain-containing protein [Candidatus Krumholzibacteriia bacterium]
MPVTAPPAPAASATWRRIRMDVLARIETLPSLSSVVVEFLELSKREYFCARDFEAILAKDQALVARLLKVANSGLYARSRTVASIAEAVVLVGFEDMKRMIFSVSAAGLLRRSLENYAYVRPHGFWLHATGVGLAARCVARAAAPCPLRPDEAFVAGLLHDVGKLIIDDVLETAPGPRRVDLAEETSTIGLDHAELGEFILAQWNLPPSIVEAVRRHHPGPDGRVPAVAAPVRLAQILCTGWGVGQQDPADLGVEIDLTGHDDLLETLGLSAAKVPQVVWEIRQSLVGLEDRFCDAR